MKSIDPGGNRVEFSAADSVRTLLELVEDRRIQVLQFSTPVPLETHAALNDQFFVHRPEVELRAYAHYSLSCDLGFCSKLGNVRRFRADCLRQASNVEAISQMPELRTLGIGIWDLDSIAFLAHISPLLEDLTISATQSKKPDLAVLEHFTHLSRCFINGQAKNLDVLGKLGKLQEIGLSSVTLPSLAFLRTIPSLEQLTILLGGTRNLADLEGLAGLKYLELCWIRELKNVDVVSSLTGLQHLSLDRLTHLQGMPDLSGLNALRRVTLDMLKNFRDVSNLASAPNLREVVHIDSKAEPEDYIPLLEKESLESARVAFGSQAKNLRFRKLCRGHQIAETPFGPPVLI